MFRPPSCRVNGFFALLVVVSMTAIIGLMSSGHVAGQDARDLEAVMTPISTKAASARIAPEAERALLSLVNRKRKQYGRQSLFLSLSLRDVARTHSGEMAREGFVGHGSLSTGSFATRFSAIVRPGTLVGENVTIASTIEAAESAFEASPGHFQNMLDSRFHYIGVGIATMPEGFAVTEDFAE
jgi:uncharacterized protein YkwD